MEEKLNQLNSYIKGILNAAFENVGINISDGQTKKVLENYKNSLYSISFKYIEDLPEFQEVLNLILKIQKFGMRAQKKETKYIDELFPKIEIMQELEKNMINKYLQKEKLSNEEKENLDKLLTLYVKNRMYSSKFIKVALEILEKNNVKINELKSVQCFMEDFTELYASVTPSEHSRQDFELMYRILYKITNQEGFDLYNNKMILDLLQIKERLPKQNQEMISGIILGNLKLYGTDSEQIKREIKNLIESNTEYSIKEKNDLLLKDIQKLKLTTNYVMPPEVINYFLKQSLSSEQYFVDNKEKYEIIFESILQDLSKNDVKESCTLFREDYSQKELKGLANSNSYVTVLAKESVKDLIESRDISILEIIYHENTHHKQNMDFKQKDKIKGNSLRKKQYKEEIIRKYNFEYYIANYDLMFNEIEARKDGKNKLLNLLNSINLADYGKQKQKLQEEIEEEDKKYKIADYKKKNIKSEEKINMEEYFDELAQKNPEIQRKYPFLFEQDYSDLLDK